MNSKVIIAGIVAGIVLYAWGFLTHMVIPLGEVGIKSLPVDKQEKVSATLMEQIPGAGLYFMPGMDSTKTGDAAVAEMERWTKAFEAGPTGILVYNPTGETPMSAKTLGIQFVIDILVGVIAAFVVSFFRNTSFVCKVSLVASLGLLAFLETDAAYWNWYRYPMDYSLAQLVDKIGGMAVVGVVLSLFFRGSKTGE